MKIKILVITLILTISLLTLTSCGTTYDKADNSHKDFCGGYFTQIKEWRDDNYTYYIVYANDTGVMYFVVNSIKKYGITPLYNSDGTLQVYHKDQ